MKKKSKIYQNSEFQKNNRETYFCSELVAQALKYVKVLPQEKSASSYWPGTFSQKNKDLKVTNGSNLDIEMILNFDLDSEVDFF